MKRRKLWKTRANRGPLWERRHDSEAAVYRYVRAKHADYDCGGWVKSVSVFVDAADLIGLGNATGEHELAMGYDMPSDETYDLAIVRALRPLVEQR